MLVTGGRRGIGFATANRFAVEGWDIALNDIDEPGLIKAANQLRERGVVVTTLLGDVGSRVEAKAMVDSIFSEHGQIDVLVNNAGHIEFAPFLDYDMAAFEETFQTNVFGAFNLTQLVSRRWVDSEATGSVVMVTSASARQARPGHSAYGSSKAALEMLARNAAMELGQHGIRVNCVSPGGPILTEFVEPISQSEGFGNRIRNTVPLGRMGTPEEVAAVIFFLATDKASYVNGAVVPVDGGVTLGRP